MDGLWGLICDITWSEKDLVDLYRFHVAGFQEPFGHVSPRFGSEWAWDPSFWTVCHVQRTLTLHGTSVQERDSNLRKTLAIDEHQRSIGLTSLAGEAFPVYTHDQVLVVNIPRDAAPVFGNLAYGVQLLAYQFDQPDSDFSNLKIWVSRRSKTKSYFPGALDVTASGALAAGESPLKGILRESFEEASLPEPWLRSQIKSTGVISYVGKSAYQPDQPSGFALPEIDFCYCVRLPSSMRPTPMDDEVEYFQLLSAPEVLQQLLQREFSPAATCVMLDFLIKRGFLTYENVPNYIEINARLHNKLLYPTL